MEGLEKALVRETADLLRNVHLPRLGTALEVLPEGDLWWRPHPGCMSFGNILLHLEGNVRQWILAGLGGEEDRRCRRTEFVAAVECTSDELLATLARTVRQASDLILGLGREELLAPRRIQGMATTGLSALLHVAEHFSWHVGQAVWIAKMRAGPDHGIAFYDEAAINRPADGSGRRQGESSDPADR